MLESGVTREASPIPPPRHSILEKPSPTPRLAVTSKASMRKSLNCVIRQNDKWLPPTLKIDFRIFKSSPDIAPCRPGIFRCEINKTMSQSEMEFLRLRLIFSGRFRRTVSHSLNSIVCFTIIANYSSEYVFRFAADGRDVSDGHHVLLRHQLQSVVQQIGCESHKENSLGN